MRRPWLAEAGKNDLQLVFPVKKKGDFEQWPAGLFIFLDAMLRPHVLTRVKGFEKGFDACEYTRFRAEANAIMIKDNAGIEKEFSRPLQEDYRNEDDSEESPSGVSPPVQSGAGVMDQAIDSLRREDYDQAICVLTELAKERPNYHVGFLRLGYAKREKAVRVVSDNHDQAVDLLRQAIAHLEKAAHHRDVEYQAHAIYERSKAYHHMGRICANDEHRSAALLDARQAYKLHGDPKYHTWLEYLERQTPQMAKNVIASDTASAGAAVVPTNEQ